MKELSLRVSGNIESYSSSEIAALESVSDVRLSEIRKRVFDASQNGSTLNYIVSGDSTRDRPKDGASRSISDIYYEKLLTQLNISVDVNNLEGIDSTEWRTNVFTQSLSQCVGFISGTGLNSIVEFSFGLNDHTTALGDFTSTKAQLVLALDALIAAKADIAILLVSPVKVAIDDRNLDLYEIYQQLSNEYDLPLVNAYEITKIVHGDPLFYTDNTHPNEFGIKRIVNKIINTIVPKTILSNLNITDLINPVITPTIESGYLYVTAGADSSFSANNRRMPPIFIYNDVVGMYVTHAGNARSVYFMDAGGNFITKISLNSSVQPGRLLWVPLGTREIRINVSNQGSAYDDLNDEIAVSFSYMDLNNINKGVNLNSQYKM